MTGLSAKLKNLADQCEARLIKETCSIKKEKIIIATLQSGGGFKDFYYFLDQNHQSYPNMNETMELYVAPNFSKQEEREKGDKTKTDLGGFITKQALLRNSMELNQEPTI